MAYIRLAAIEKDGAQTKALVNTANVESFIRNEGYTMVAFTSDAAINVVETLNQIETLIKRATE